MNDGAQKDSFSKSTLSSGDNNSTFAASIHFDLFDCRKDLIKSESRIAESFKRLCYLLAQRAYRDPVIVYFAEPRNCHGYTAVQFVGRTVMSGHFDDVASRAYIDIFLQHPIKTDAIKKIARDLKTHFRPLKVKISRVRRCGPGRFG